MSRDADRDTDRSLPGDRPRARRPGPTALLVLYPAAWRRRYGDELDALIVDMHAEGRPTGWRLRVDLLRSGLRERLRGGRRGDPAPRIRGGASLVLWAWALFVLAGSIVAKTGEHWRQALAAHPGAVPEAAFGGLIAIAVATAALVATGIAVTLPAAARFLRDGGWRTVGPRAALAGALTLASLVATAALVIWAHRLTPAARNGHDGLYVVGFLGWAALGAAALLAWTAVAARIARGADCRRGVLRAQALIAPLVAVAMAAMTGATVVWWITVAGQSPAALTGGPAAGHPSALVPQLALAGVMMLGATAIAAVGAARADVALADL